MKNSKECCYLLLTTAAAAAAADTADSFYAANTVGTADNFGWVDGCLFGVMPWDDEIWLGWDFVEAELSCYSRPWKDGMGREAGWI